jgi:nicotinate phosphoribosyltransferase
MTNYNVKQIYGISLALLTDMYQLTMAYGYWKSGIHEREAVFHWFFRKNPFYGGYTVACGLEAVIGYLQGFQFSEEDISYLASMKGADARPLFERTFLDYLKSLSLSCHVDAVPEGTVVFPQEPLLRIHGPLIQCQLLETSLLNLLNFPSLIATKASRVCFAAQGDDILEFGLRRAQGIDGALTASRAAYIGGCAATSNILAGHLFGIPVKGTHAHSWVMSFDDEEGAFEAYAKAMPNNCVFLVDTYDTLEGVKKACKIGHWLRQRGHRLLGIRLDSGDLAYLSIKARRILDEEGFPEARILASNDLDEHIIKSLKEQGAKIAIWGVGTKMVTAYDQAALGGVYKLSAMKDSAGRWRNKIKLSEQGIKISNPGIQQVRRYYTADENIADVIYDVSTDMSHGCTIIDPWDMTRQKTMGREECHEDLLVPVFKEGRCVYHPPDIHVIRKRTFDQLARFHAGVKRFENPHQYPVGLEKSLFDLKTRLILKIRGHAEEVDTESP